MRKRARECKGRYFKVAKNFPKNFPKHLEGKEEACDLMVDL